MWLKSTTLLIVLATLGGCSNPLPPTAPSHAPVSDLTAGNTAASSEPARLDGVNLKPSASKQSSYHIEFGQVLGLATERRFLSISGVTRIELIGYPYVPFSMRVVAGGVEVEFRAQLGLHIASFFAYDGSGPPISIIVVGEGVNALIEREVKFPATPVGSTSHARIHIRKTKNTLVAASIGTTVGGRFTLNDSHCRDGLNFACEIDVAFRPEQTGASSVAIRIAEDRGEFDQIVILLANATPPRTLSAGPGIQLSVAPASINFGQGDVRRMAPEQSLTVTNHGERTLMIAIREPSAPFYVDRRACTGRLDPSTQCVIVVDFVPQAVGQFGSNIELRVGEPADNVRTQIELTGQGVAVPPPTPPAPPPTPPAPPPPPNVLISPESKDFGTLTASAGYSYQFTVTNAGGSTATITSVSLSQDPTAVMSIGANTCTGQVLSGGQTCTVTVVIASNVSTGRQNGQLSIATSAGTVTAPLTYLRVM